MAIIGGNNFSTIPAYARAVEKSLNAKRCLCFGDSWFQYPPRPIDIEKLLARAFRNTLFLNEGVAGRVGSSARPRARR